MKPKTFTCLTFLFFMLFSTHFQADAQGIYSARGYWEESNKEMYRLIKQKSTNGIALSPDESSYLSDFETYLSSYFQRLSANEKAFYNKMKSQWDQELFGPQQRVLVEEEFEWRGRDYATNIFYGFYYGLSFVAITEISSTASIGIPLLTGGLWALGPVIVPRKYKDITRPVLRASNTGKFLGLINGASFALMVGGDSENTGQLALGLSSLASIALGEVGFHLQKKRNFSEGHIELVRHYGVVGPWLGLVATASLGSDNSNLYGASLLAGGVAGMLVANKVSSKYAYTKGDVNNISAMTLGTTGLGFAIAAEAITDDFSTALILIPAAGTIAGTILAQKAVKGVNLTKKQGSTIGLSTGGAALVGLGLAAVFESNSASVIIGLPAVMALATQQILFSNYKKTNLSGNLLGIKDKDKSYRFSVKVTPENYLINQKMPVHAGILNPNANVSNPLFNFKLNF